jgi:twitching motility protein PilT
LSTLTFKSIAEAALDRFPNASDLFIAGGRCPFVRVEGNIQTFEDFNVISSEIVDELCRKLLEAYGNDISKQSNQEENIKTPPVYGSDFGINAAGSRWRINVSLSKQFYNLAARRLNENPPKLDYLGFENKNLFELTNGLCVIAGPTGMGKTTTMASAVSHLAKTRPWNFITAEDPIEYIIEDGIGLVNQREIGKDTPSFDDALKDALRQNPDCIVLGEMRDP